MNKYNKILDLFQQLIQEIESLSEAEFKKLMLGLKLAILKDELDELNQKEAKANEQHTN